MSDVVAQQKMVVDYQLAGSSEEKTAELASKIAYNLLMQAAHCKDFTVRIEIYPTELISKLQNEIKDLKDINQNLQDSISAALV